MTSKTIPIRNFPCTLIHCPVVLTSLKAGLVSTTVSALKVSALGLVGPVSVYCDWVRLASSIRYFYLSATECAVAEVDPPQRYLHVTLSNQETKLSIPSLLED